MKFLNAMFAICLFSGVAQGMQDGGKIEKREPDFGSGPVVAYVQKSETAMLYVQRRVENDGQEYFLGHISALPLYLGGTTELDNGEFTKKLWFGLNYEYAKSNQKSKSPKDIIGHFEQLIIKNK